MTRTIIEPLRDFQVIIMGELEDARTAAGLQGIQRPLRRVSRSRYAIHATLSTDRETLERWFAQSHERRPGDLLFYFRNTRPKERP